MSTLATISTVLGIATVITRAPLIFAPLATQSFYRKVIENKFLLRIAGIFTVLLSIAMVNLARKSSQSAAVFLSILGWIFAVIAVFELVFASLAQEIGTSFYEMKSSTARINGVFTTALGTFFIYLGLMVF